MQQATEDFPARHVADYQRGYHRYHQSLTGFKMIFHEFHQAFGRVLYGTINGLGGSSEQESSDKRFTTYEAFLKLHLLEFQTMV